MEGRKVKSGQELVEEAHRKLKEFKQVLFEKERSENSKTYQEKDSKANEIQLGNGTGKGSMTVNDAWAVLEETVLGLMKWITAEGAQPVDQLSEATRKEVVPELGGVSTKAEIKLATSESEPLRKKMCAVEAEGNAVRGSMNPLDIPNIVASIAGYIDRVEDMKSARALNSIWNRETFRKWRSTAVFLINYETIPVLLKAFGEIDADLSQQEKAETLARTDPFRLHEVPFKRYRFAKSQMWMYPLDDDEEDLERKLIWEKCINPNATYLDVGQCKLKAWNEDEHDSNRMSHYLSGIRWILCHSSNVTEFAIAPMTSYQGYDYPEGGQMPILRAQQVTTLTIGSPVDKPGFERSFLCLDADLHMDFLKMLPNLKVLNLSRHGLDNFYIIKGLINSTRFGFNRLECLNALEVDEIEEEDYLESVNKFLEVLENRSSLKELKLAVRFNDAIEDYEDKMNRYPWNPDNLEFVRESLIKLEFRVDYDYYPEPDIPENLNFYIGDCSFPNLTHFKVQLDYTKFYGKMRTFDFSNLMKMPSLREFHFGSKNCVERSEVIQKVNLVEPDDANQPEKSLENYEMPDLKSFHFHGNFKKEAIQQLGKIMGKLETLELVFDKENCLVVQDIWPHLKNLKLLPCSDVPEEMVSSLKDSIKSLNVVDESNDWSPAKEEELDESNKSNESDVSEKSDNSDEMDDSSDEYGESDGEAEYLNLNVD